MDIGWQNASGSRRRLIALHASHFGQSDGSILFFICVLPHTHSITKSAESLPRRESRDRLKTGQIFMTVRRGTGMRKPHFSEGRVE